MNKEEICYTVDASRIESKPLQVFYPKTKEDIQKIIREHVNIVPRGSGTNLVGGTIAENSVVVEMRGLNKIISINTSKKTVHVEAGITIKELNEKLKQINSEFPICFNEQSTIGSMIAVNAVGEHSMRYGLMKEWIEKIEFVNGKNELLTIGKADLAEVCGMEGTTGIIVSALLRCMPIIKKTASILQSDNLDEILSTSQRLKSDVEVIRLKFYSKKVSKMLGFPEKYHVIVFFNSTRGKIQENEFNKLLGMIQKEYYYLYKNNYYESEDVRLFFDKIKEYVTQIEALDIPCIGDLGMGIINTFFTSSEMEKMRAVKKLMIKTSGKKGRYAIGVKRKYLIDDLEKKIFYRIKKRHDPLGKMNKGKLFDYIPDIEIQKIDEEARKEIKEAASEETREEINEKLKEEINEKPNKEIGETDRIFDNKEENFKEEYIQQKFEKQTITSEIKREKQDIIEKKTSMRELNTIKNIMFNNYKKNENKTNEVGVVNITDNLERKHLTGKKSEVKKENDLIKSIMTNTFKKTDIKDNEKKEEEEK